MFKYLPSVENALPTAPGSIDATAYKSPLSAYFAQSVNYDALNGIIDSVVAVLGAKGTDKEDINAKIREAFRSHIPGVTKFIIAQRVSSISDSSS